MRLSFVVPAYNEEAYVGPCIEAILKQIEHLPANTAEVIVVNNASTDRTHDVAASYPGVRVVDEMQKGLTFARQAGYAASTGDLVAHVDSDSRITPGWVDQVLTAFDDNDRKRAANPAAKPLVALSGPIVYYDLNSWERIFVNIFYLMGWGTYMMNKYVLRIGSMVQGGNFVTARSGLDAIGGFNTAIAFYGEDTDIARRMSKVGEVRFTFSLKVLSSARRLKKEGMVYMAFKYAINYFWTTFFKKPFSEEYVDHREPLPNSKE